MARRVKDITQTGPVGLKGIRGTDLYKQMSSDASQGNEDAKNLLNFLGTPRHTPGSYGNVEAYFEPVRNQNKTGFEQLGNSSYDDPFVWGNNPEVISDMRADRQGWLTKIGAGLSKGVVLAGTTFLDGTIGLATGIYTAINEGRWSGLWDNDFSKAMQAVNEWSENTFANYYSNEELEKPWYENIFSANFLGDKFLKNLGFTVGAFYSGGLVTKPIKGIGALAKLGTLAKAEKGILTAAEAADRVKDIAKATNIVSSGIGSVVSAVNEGRIEALNNSTDWYEAQKELVDQAYERGELSNDEYQLALAQANEDKLKMGNADLLMNIPILTASNIIQFGKMYANGFKTGKKGLNIVGSPGNWTSGSSRAGAIWGITKGALSEGTEEITQSAASRISGDYYASDINNFIKAKTDLDSAQSTLDWVKAFAQGINETVNEGSSWEEFFIGSLTGALGMPRFRSIRNERGGLQSPITIEEGAINSWREYQRGRDREEEIAVYMNDRFNSPEFKNYYQGLVRHNKYQTDMDKAVENDDPFSYHNAEHAQMVSDVMMFDKAGKTQELVDMINEAFDTSDENLVSIVENTTSTTEDGKKVGPFVDESGNPLYSTAQGKQKMIEQLTQNKDRIIKAVDDFRLSREAVQQAIPTGTQLTDDQLDELTWMHSQIGNWAERAVSMSGEVKSAIGKIIGQIDGRIAAQTSIRTAEGMKSGELTNAYKKADKEIQKLTAAKETLNHVRSLSDETLANSLSSTENTDFVNMLRSNMLVLPESVMSDNELEDALHKLDDIKKLAKGKEAYQDKLKEYLGDPSKQAADHQRIEEDQVIEEQTRTRSSLIDALSSAQDMSSFRKAYEDSDLEQIDKEAALRELEESGNQMAKDYKDVESYKREVRRVLTQSNISDQVLQDAYQLLQDQHVASANLQEMANSNSVHINNDTAFDETSETADISTQRFQAAQYALQQAMAKVNNDNRFKDRFAPEHPAPVDRTDNPNPTKGTNKDTIGDSGTTTVPPVNGNQQPGSSFTPPVGNISAGMVAEENRQTNTLRTESPDDLDNQQSGARPYYRPSIPELHIVGSKEGDFRPFNEVVREREQGVNFDAIYDYLRDKGAFTYVNEGKLRVGDEISFMIDPEFEEMVKDATWHTKPTIFMATKDGQIVGSLDDSDYSVAKFEGLAGLEERIRREYAKAKSQQAIEKPFIASPKTRVSKVMVGKIAYGNEERSLADIPNVRGKNGDKAPIFGIVKNGTISTNGAVNDSVVIKPVDMAQKEGRMYLLVPNGAGKYSPVAVRVKHFNTTEFNLNDVTIAGTPIAKDIIAGIQRMTESANDLDLEEAVKSLSKDLYLGNLHIDWFTSSQGNGIRFTQVERDADGNEIYLTDTDGQRKRKETVKTVFMTEKWDSNILYTLGADDTPQTAPATKDPSAVAKEITDVLTGFNLPIQVSIDRLNTRGYTNRLINSGILTSNVVDARVIGTWFTTDYFDREGKLQSAVSPASVAPQQGRKVETPVGGKNSAIPGISINLGGKTLNVDLQNNLIYEDGKPRLIEKYRDRLIVDLAWAQSIHGDRTEGHNMHNNCIITPSGQVLNRATRQYLTEDEAQRIKDVIEGRNRTQRERQEKAQQVVGRIYDAQQRVDKTRTDSEHYYILEDDGEYHAYDRVHTRIGSNWVESPKQTEALKQVQVTLSKLADNLVQFDDHLEQLEKKYDVDLSSFRGKVDIKSREMILNVIRDTMSGSNSTRALQAGSAVDTVIRQYFTTSDLSTITKPSNLTEEAFNNLVDRLQQVKNNMEAQGMKFLTDNIVLYQKYPDGIRVAGEVDILAVDRDGNFRIYDVKTSRYSFGNFTDRYGHSVNHFENKSRTQQMSTRDYYTLQLSAYKNLFESQFGEPITQIGIMPFVLSYDKDMVSGITGEAGITLQYNSSVNVPLIGNARQGQAQSTQPTQRQPNPQSSAPIFDANAETHNPINMVIPEAAFDGQGTQTGYYILDGKVHRGYLLPIGEINGVPIHITKVPNITKGFGRQGEEAHVASTNYVAVFPNGQTVTVMSNVTVDTEQQAIDKIKAALSGNPKRVTDESVKETVLSKPQKSVEMSGSARTIQAEQAISKKDPKRVRRRLRRATDDSATIWDKDKEIAEITRMLPQLQAEDRIRFVSGLIRVADRGALAWGQMEDGIITLSDIASPGTAYHEAFHVVFNHLLDNNERAALLQEARGRFGKRLSEEELEEELAEEFRMFQMGEITDERSLGRKVIDFFKSLLTKVTNWKYFKPSSMAYYQAIRKGEYANKTLRDVVVSRVSREEYTQEMKDILSSARRDSQGRLLAPNGKPSNLTERQYVHVRTKSFKEWFGDWENNPENASKVIDENGEPMVVYHGTPNDWTVFDTNKTGSITDDGYYGRGLYLSSLENKAREYTRSEFRAPMELFANIRHPFYTGVDSHLTIAEANRRGAIVNTFNRENQVEELKQYDGVLYTGGDGRYEEIVVKDPNQIKSAIENKGSYSRDNNDIRYRRTGQAKVETFDMVPQEERLILEKKGWTAEHFNRVSQEERDKALECLGL